MQLYFGMKPISQVSLLSLFLLPLNAGLWADTLYLKKGESLQGTFLGLEKGYYKFQTQDGKVHCILREETRDIRAIQNPKARPEKTEAEKAIVCGESEPPIKEKLTPEGKPLPKEGLLPEGKPLPKEGLIPEGKPLQKEEALPKDELSPKEKPLPKKEALPKDELSQKEEPPQKKSGKSFLDSFLQIFRDFFKRYPLSKGVFLGMGKAHLVYTGTSPFSTITYSDLGASDITGELEAEYPNFYEGPFVGLGLFLELNLARLHRPLGLQMGLDYNHASRSKSDRPLGLSGTGTIVATGEMLAVESKTEYNYSYNYLSLFFGPSYRLPTLELPYINLDNFYLTTHVRLFLSGSYTLKLNSETAGGADRESFTETGSLNKNGLGFGFSFGKKFNWPKNYKTSLNFSYSYDRLDFAGVRHDNTFYGLRLGLEF